MRRLEAATWLAASIYLYVVSGQRASLAAQKSLDGGAQRLQQELPVITRDDTKESLLEYQARALLRQPPLRRTNAHTGMDEDALKRRQPTLPRPIRLQSQSIRPQSRSRMHRVRKRRPISRRLRVKPTPVNSPNRFVTQPITYSKGNTEAPNKYRQRGTQVQNRHRQQVTRAPQRNNDRFTKSPSRVSQRVARVPSRSSNRITQAPRKTNHRFARKIVEGTLQNVRGGARLISARGNYGYVPLVNKLIDNATLIREKIVEGFDCKGRTYGYYADQLNDCQIFHICVPMKQIFPDHFTENDIYHFSFICPEYTIFSQDAMVCAWKGSAVPCAEAHNLYYMNQNFFVVSNDDVQKEKPPPQTGGYQASVSRPQTVASRPQTTGGYQSVVSRPLSSSGSARPTGTYTGASLITPSRPTSQVAPRPYQVPAGGSQGRKSVGSLVQNTQESDDQETETTETPTTPTPTEEETEATTMIVPDTTAS